MACQHRCRCQRPSRRWSRPASPRPPPGAPLARPRGHARGRLVTGAVRVPGGGARRRPAAHLPGSSLRPTAFWQSPARWIDHQLVTHSMAPTSWLMMSSSSVRLRAAVPVPTSCPLLVRHRAGARHSGSPANAATQACANRASRWPGAARPKCSAYGSSSRPGPAGPARPGPTAAPAGTPAADRPVPPPPWSARGDASGAASPCAPRRAPIPPAPRPGPPAGPRPATPG